MHHQNKGKGVYFSPVISMYIYLYCLYSLCLCVFYLFVFTYELMAYSREGISALFGAHFLEKTAFCLLKLPKQMPFLSISNKNIFLKAQDNILGAIVPPNKRLE